MIPCPFEGCLTPAPHGHAASSRPLRPDREWDELDRVIVMDAGDVAATGTATRDIVVWVWRVTDKHMDALRARRRVMGDSF